MQQDIQHIRLHAENHSGVDCVPADDDTHWRHMAVEQAELDNER